MRTKPEVTKLKRSRSFDQITKLKPKLKPKLKLCLFESTKLKPKPKPRCFQAIIDTPFYSWLLSICWNLGKIYSPTWFENEKCFSSFETTKPNVKFWICEVTKLKLKPKLFSSHEAEAEAEAEALRFWNHETEAKAEALASNASASWSRSWSSFVPMSDARKRCQSSRGLLGTTRECETSQTKFAVISCTLILVGVQYVVLLVISLH